MKVNQKVNILLILLLIVVVSFMYWLLSNPVADDYNFSAFENLKNREYTKSIEDYDKAIELDSTDAELYNMRGVAKNDFFMFDEAHENFAFLFYGHGCHVRHQTEDRLVTFANRYDQSKLQPIYEMANKTPIILLSDTLTCIICEELPMYSGLLPIDIIVVEPELSYYRDIPEFDHVDKSEAEDHINEFDQVMKAALVSHFDIGLEDEDDEEDWN